MYSFILQRTPCKYAYLVLARPKEKGPARDPSLSTKSEGVLGQIHQRGGGGNGQAKDQQKHGRETIKEAFEFRKRHKRHDTILFNLIPEGAGPFLCEQC